MEKCMVKCMKLYNTENLGKVFLFRFHDKFKTFLGILTTSLNQSFQWK